MVLHQKSFSGVFENMLTKIYERYTVTERRFCYRLTAVRQHGTDELISLELCMQFLKTLTGLQSKGKE